MYFKSISHELQLPCETAACHILLKVTLYSSSVGVLQYITDVFILTFEEVLFKMSYSVDTLPTYLDYLKTIDGSNLNTFHAATSECVKKDEITHNKIAY